MLNLRWTVSQETIDNLRARGPRLIQVLSSKLFILMAQLGSFVQEEKLSGQMVKPVTGNLRASVHAVPTEIQGTKLIARVVAAEPPISYGVALEKGTRTHEVLAVKGKLLKFLIDGKPHFAPSVVIPQQMPKPFMGLSEQENASIIYEELKKAVSDEVEKP